MEEDAISTGDFERSLGLATILKKDRNNAMVLSLSFFVCR